MGYKLGIDFGTSNSGAAVFDGGQVRLLPLDTENAVPEIIKTILYITRDQQCHIGQAAIELYYRQNVNHRRRFAKKWLGEIEVFGGDMYYVRDVYSYVDELMPGRLLQFIKTALRTPGLDGTMIFDKFYSLQEIIRLYLTEIRQRSEAILGGSIDAVTLGRPVKFSQDRTQDEHAQGILRSAAEAAGFANIHFELEPIAAAAYYELSLTRPETALIFDFGGGTLDVTILRLGDPKNRQVYANGGIDIAGSDFDKTIIQKRLLRHFGQGQLEGDYELEDLVNAVADWIALPDLSTPKARLRLEQAIQRGIAPARLKTLENLIFNDLAFTFYNRVEAAKIALSDSGAAVIDLEETGLHLWELLSRNQFESDIAPLADQIEAVVLDTLARSGFEPGQIDSVVTTGGSSGIPLFNRMLARLFGAGKLHSSHAFSSVTAGLSIKASEI